MMRIATHRRLPSALAALALGGLLPPAGLSAATPQKPGIYHLGEIVVTGRKPRVVEEVTTTEVVTAEEIAGSGARTLDEAIADRPGLQLRRGAEGTTLIDLRGLRSRNLLLLLDGVPLNSSFDGLFDPGTLPVRHLARVKLTRGASSVLYGSAGGAGVIELVTRAAEGGSSSLYLEGLSDSLRLDAQASLRRERLGLVASGAFYDQDHFDLSGDFVPTLLEDGGRRLASDRRDGALFTSLSFDPAPGRSLGLSLGYRGGERGKPPVTEDFRTSPFAPRPRFERVDSDSLSMHAGMSFLLGPDLTLRPALFLNRTAALTDGFDDETYSSQAAAGAFREDATTSTMGASVQLGLERGGHGRLTLGLDLRQEEWDARGFRISGGGGGMGGGGGGGGGGGPPATEPFDEDRSVRQGSLAAELELASGPWSGVLGVGFSAQRRPGTGEEDAAWSFLLGATRALGRGLVLRGSVGRQVRFPTLRDLFDASRGNPALEAESTLAWELGLERAWPAGTSRLELTLFLSDADDFIQGIPGERLSNTEAVRRRGIELSGRHRLVETLRLRWSYTWLDTRNRSPNAKVEEIQNQPRHKFALGAEHETTSGLRLRGDVLHVADRVALSRARPTRTLDLGDVTVLSLGVSSRLGTERLRLYGRLANALDESYVESIGFPAPGRTFLLGLELRAARR